MLLPMALLLAGALTLLLAAGLRRRAGLPPGRVLTSDAGARPGQMLVSVRHGLHGRPDYLVRQGRRVIPVELKPTRDRAHPSAVMQLMAYCLLVEERHGRPRHGLLVLRDRVEEIAYTDQRREDLLRTLAAMRAAPAVPPRGHQQAARCRACAFAPICTDALAPPG